MLTTLVLRHFSAVFAVRCKYTVEAVQSALGFGTNAASCAMKSSGSNITWVVPSLEGIFSWAITDRMSRDRGKRRLPCWWALAQVENETVVKLCGRNAI